METIRVFFYPFLRSHSRIQPFGIRRRVPPFLSSTVEPNQWSETLDQIDQAIGDQRAMQVRMLRESILGVILVCLAFPLGGCTQGSLCYLLPVGRDIFCDDVWEAPFLPIVFGIIYGILAVCFTVRRQVSLLAKRDKVLCAVQGKVKYRCDEVNADGTMYLRPRVNYDTGMIAVDVYRNKPPPETSPAKTSAQVPNPKNATNDPLVLAVV